MSPAKRALLSLTLMSIPAWAYCDCLGNPSTWTGTPGDGTSWSDVNNWNPNTCFPNNTNDTAIFPTPLPSGAFTPSVNVVGGVTLKVLEIDGDPANDYIIGGPESITFQNASSATQINYNSQPARGAEIAAPLFFNTPNSLGGTQIKEVPIGSFLSNLTFSGPVTIESGASATNVGSNTNNVQSTLAITGAFTLNSATFINAGSSATMTAATLQKNVAAIFNSPFSIGTGSSVQNTSQNAVNDGAGTEGADMAFNNTVTISGGDLLNSFSGSVGLTTPGGVGCQIAGTDLIITAGTLTNETALNTVQVVGGTGAIIAVTPGNTTVSGSSQLKNINVGSVTSTTGGAHIANGAELLLRTLNISSGSILNSNTGPVSVGTGSVARGAFVNANTINISGNAVVTNSSNPISDPNCFGSLMVASNSITLSGSAVLDNVNPSGGNQTYLQSPTITLNGGTLSGNGFVKGTNATPIGTNGTTLTNNSGNIQPSNGSGTGTMTITGSYTQGPAGTFTERLTSASSSSQLVVTGTGTTQLDGTLAVNFLSGNTISPSDSIVILQTDPSNTLSGQFATVTFNSSNLVPHVSYILGPNGEVILTFTTSMGGPTLAPSYAGGFMETLISDINHINSQITQRMNNLHRRFKHASKRENANLAIRPERDPSQLTASSDSWLSFINPQTREKQEQLRREVASEANELPWNFYFGPTGRAFGDLHTRKDQPGLDYWSAGALMGFDYAFSQVGLGFMADYDRIEAHAKQHWGKITTDEFHASIYSTYVPKELNALALNGIVGGAYELNYIRRNTGTVSDPRVAVGTPHGAAFDALLGMEYAIGNRFQFIPLANAQYVYLRTQRYEEHGAGAFDMEVRSQRIKSLRSALGFRMNYTMERTNFSFVPEIYAEWQREFLNKSRHLRFTPVDFEVPSEILIMPGTGRNIALAGADFLFTFYKRYGIEASYEVEYNSLYHDHFFYLGTNFRF